MTRTVLVPLAPGFEEIEAVTIVDVLRRGGIKVTTASLRGLEVEGSHGITLRADRTLDAVRGETFDAVVLPGGMPGASNLRDDPRIREELRAAVGRGGIAAAICAAPIALEAAGLLDGRRATAYPSFRDQLVSAKERLAAHVVEDGQIVTSAGPGTALEFALALVGRLAGADVAAGLKSGLLV